VRTGTGSAGPRLFPNWKRGEDGYYSSGFSKWFARFLNNLGLKDPRLVFHSFRHGFKDALRRAMVEERIQDAIMGHEPEHVSSEYGLGYGPAELNKAIKPVSYIGLDLSVLRPLKA
jgi:integrase